MRNNSVKGGKNKLTNKSRLDMSLNSNSLNNSFNKNVNIHNYVKIESKPKSEERPNLKDIVGKERTFSGYCLGLSQFKSKDEGYLRVLLVNVHLNNVCC